MNKYYYLINLKITVSIGPYPVHLSGIESVSIRVVWSLLCLQIPFSQDILSTRRLWEIKSFRLANVHNSTDSDSVPVQN